MLFPIVLVDLDGTLADVTHIEHLVQGRKKDFDSFHRLSTRAPSRELVVRVIQALARMNFSIHIVTGRTDDYQKETATWLSNNLIPHVDLHMRVSGDFRPDEKLKYEFYEQIIGIGDVVLAIDDNPKIIKLWRDLKIPTVYVPGTMNNFGRSLTS